MYLFQTLSIAYELTLISLISSLRKKTEPLNGSSIITSGFYVHQNIFF